MMMKSRFDGRQEIELRPRKAQLGELRGWDGSARYSQGNTTVLVTLNGPVAARSNQELFDSAVVNVTVQRGATEASGGGATKYIIDTNRAANANSDAAVVECVAAVTKSAVCLERYPRAAFEVRVVILQDDGSLQAVTLNALMCALLDAGIYCRTTFAAVSVATKSAEQFLLDPSKAELSSEWTESVFAFSLDGGLIFSSVVRHCVGPSSTAGSHSASTSIAEVLNSKSIAWSVAPPLFAFYRNCCLYQPAGGSGNIDGPSSSGVTLI